MALQELGAGLGALSAVLLDDGSAGALDDKAMALLKSAMDEYGNIDPNVLRELEAQLQGDTELGKIREDGSLRAAQMNALSRMQQVGNEGGMTAIDRARLNDVNNSINQQSQARRQAMMTQAAQRGQMGSGLMYADMLSGEQGAVEAASRQGFDVAAEAQRRALEAMQQSGQMAGNIRGQDYGIAANRANAQDRINQYNTELRNKMNQYNNSVRQGNFDNQMNLTGAKNKARGAMADAYQDRAGGIRQRNYSIGAGAGGLAGAVGDFAISSSTGIPMGGFGGKAGKGYYDYRNKNKDDNK